MLVTLSVRDVKGLTKDERGDIFHYHRHIECEFNRLLELLSKDYLYNAFAYLGHQRNNSNICNKANLMILDIDHTNTAMSQVFNDIITEGFQVIVSTTSDPNNEYKYRVLLPLDKTVTAKEYRRLVYGLEQNKLISDIDYKASHAGQMIYAYKDSKILSNFDGTALPVDDYISDEQELQYSDEVLDLSELQEIMIEFKSYSQAQKGSRTKALLSAGFRLMESGASDSQISTVLLSINSSFLVPKPINEVKRRVLNYLKTQRENK